MSIFTGALTRTVAVSKKSSWHQKLRGVSLFRAIYFSPVVTPTVVAAVVWSFLYNPGQGLINTFVETISLGHLGPYNWLSDEKMALPAHGIGNLAGRRFPDGHLPGRITANPRVVV
jgi:ABC-type sugar transport system permease subunit